MERVSSGNIAMEGYRTVKLHQKGPDLMQVSTSGQKPAPAPVSGMLAPTCRIEKEKDPALTQGIIFHFLTSSVANINTVPMSVTSPAFTVTFCTALSWNGLCPSKVMV